MAYLAWHARRVKNDIKQIATDWIAYAHLDPKTAPDEIFARGWVLQGFVEDDPEAAWATIKEVVSRYTEEELYSFQKTEAQDVVGLTAAGPLEDLLSAHGSGFIDRVEEEARRDKRMAWTLGGVWQLDMTDDIWERVQRASDKSFWNRPVAN